MVNQHTFDELCGTYGHYNNIPSKAHESDEYQIVERSEQGYRVEWVG